MMIGSWWFKILSRLPYVTVTALLVLSGGAAFAQSSGGSQRSHCTLDSDPGLAASAAANPDLNGFPVIVHYMQHEDYPEDDPSDPEVGGLSRETLKSYFAPNGKFNEIWAPNASRPKGVQFVLVGIETCTYRLKRLNRNYTERESMPSPNADPGLPSRVFRAFNTRTYQAGNESKPFHGLDLYVWWDIRDSTAGYGAAPRLRQSASGSFRLQRRGGVWLDRDCLMEPDQDACARLFGHEAGHFFGLCHVCAMFTSPETAGPNCSTTCPTAVPPGQNLPTCASGETRVMAANWNGKDVQQCELDFATDYAAKLLNRN